MRPGEKRQWLVKAWQYQDVLWRNVIAGCPHRDSPYVYGCRPCFFATGRERCIIFITYMR